MDARRTSVGPTPLETWNRRAAGSLSRRSPPRLSRYRRLAASHAFLDRCAALRRSCRSARASARSHRSIRVPAVAVPTGPGSRRIRRRDSNPCECRRPASAARVRTRRVNPMASPLGEKSLSASSVSCFVVRVDGSHIHTMGLVRRLTERHQGAVRRDALGCFRVFSRSELSGSARIGFDLPEVDSGHRDSTERRSRLRRRTTAGSDRMTHRQSDALPRSRRCWPSTGPPVRSRRGCRQLDGRLGSRRRRGIGPWPATRG